MGLEIFVFGFLGLAYLVSPVVLLIWQLVNRERIGKLERSQAGVREVLEARLEAIEGRLRTLDGASADDVNVAAAVITAADAAVSDSTAVAPDSAAASVAGATGAESGPATPEPTATPIAPATSEAAPEQIPAAAAASADPAADQRSAPSPRKRPRGNADWEELIGGSWLNKLGVLVLIVGIALLLGYSMTNLGPEGRVGLGLAVSAALLAGGAVLEGRERYRVVARGLIGGGWAGLYFTTFAMHGIEAARIIESALVGTVLLLAVAVGMLLHSMTYRSETVTALAYFVTFATLAITPASRFALLASVPVAASLLYLGRRFTWPHMMVAGVVFTYGAYLARAMSPTIAAADDWVFGQSLLFVYWVMFEVFDLLSLRRRGSGGIDETLFPVNAAGFLLASLMVWNMARPETLWLFFVLAAGIFAASTLVRVWLLGMGREDDEADVGTRLRSGGYEGASVLAAVLLLLAIGERLDGWQQNVAWLLQSQLIMLSGLMLRVPFLRHLGSVVLIAPVAGVLFEDLPSSRTVVALGRTWWQSTPTALLTAAILYLDRALVRRARGVTVAGLEHLYNWVGTFLIAAVVANELPDVWVAPAWLVFGLALLGYSRGRGAGEVFLQGYLLVVAAWFVAVFVNVPSGTLVWGLQARWITALPMVPIFYGLAYMHRVALLRVAAVAASEGAGDEDAATVSGAAAGDTANGAAAEVTGFPSDLVGLVERLDLGAAVVMSVGATLLTSWFLLFEVSGRWLTVAWGLQGVALLAIGIALAARGMRVSGLALLVICVAKVFFYDLNELETIFKIFSFIILGSLLIGVSFAYSRYREQIRRLL